MTTLRALECLVALIDTGSVTKAAAALHLSQPALSHQIAAFERELGTPVVLRLPRGARPTEAGLAAAEHARAALAAAERSVVEGKRAAAGEGGRIRIACAETMTAWLLVPVLRLWRRRRPGVELDLKEFTRMRRVPASELAGEQLVHYNPDNGNAIWLDQFAAARGVVLPVPALRTGSPRTAAQLAAAGMGVAVVPYSALGSRANVTIRSFDPVELRDVIVVVANPQDELVSRFVGDLRGRGLPPPSQLDTV